MKFLLHLTRGADWTDATHDEIFACGRELTLAHGGAVAEVTLTRRDNMGEADPPYATRLYEERAVVVETSLEALAAWAEDHDAVVQVMSCSRWQDSNVGRLTHRLFISDSAGDDAGNAGPSWGGCA